MLLELCLLFIDHEYVIYYVFINHIYYVLSFIMNPTFHDSKKKKKRACNHLYNLTQKQGTFSLLY